MAADAALAQRHDEELRRQSTEAAQSMGNDDGNPFLGQVQGARRPVLPREVIELSSAEEDEDDEVPDLIEVGTQQYQGGGMRHDQRSADDQVQQAKRPRVSANPGMCKKGDECHSQAIKGNYGYCLQHRDKGARQPPQPKPLPGVQQGWVTID